MKDSDKDALRAVAKRELGIDPEPSVAVQYALGGPEPSLTTQDRQRIDWITSPMGYAEHERALHYATSDFMRSYGLAYGIRWHVHRVDATEDVGPRWVVSRRYFLQSKRPVTTDDLQV